MKENKTETKCSYREIDSAELHSACRFVGKTEATLNKAKLPTAEMYWVPNEGILVSIKNQEILIPAANVKFIYFKKQS